jgi:cob(I)alamin adenosyltransferase
MSIVTKRGDQGMTALMYNRQVPKCDPRVEAYGAVDELNAAIGLARAAAKHKPLQENLTAIQKDLVPLMGELATAGEDLPRYVKDGHSLVSPAMTATLEKWIAELEAAKVSATGWVMPGANAGAAALDFARTVCRRAERRACALQESRQLRNHEIVIYLNRLSDLLWLLARWAEAKQPRKS